ncbi:unnamed protein product [Parajaminaea phylloscopi]
MASTSAVPPGVRKWLKGQYPTLTVKEAWLAETVSRIRERAGSSVTDAQLIQKTHEALLQQDLASFAQGAVLPQGSNSKPGQHVLGAGARGGVLLQVVSKIDVGVSAQKQLEVLEARKAARVTAEGAALLEREAAQHAASSARGHPNGSGLEPPTGDEGDHMADFHAAEEATNLPATVFPRSTLQFELSDGFTMVKALEHRRIASLSMAETRLGSKLLVKGAQVAGGLLLLTPEVVEVKGGVVASMDADAESKLIERLKRRLGKWDSSMEQEQPSRTLKQASTAVSTPGLSATPRASAPIVLDNFADDEEVFNQLHQADHGEDRDHRVSTGARRRDAPPKASEGSTSRFFASSGASEPATRSSQSGVALSDAIVLSDSD